MTTDLENLIASIAIANSYKAGMEFSETYNILKYKEAIKKFMKAIEFAPPEWLPTNELNEAYEFAKQFSDL